VKLVGTWEKDHRRIRKYEFTSEQPYRLYFYVLDRGETTKPGTVHLEVLDAEQWQVWVSRLQACTGDAQPCQLEDFDETRVLFAPRGVVAAAWASDLKKATHIRRSFALLGTTEDRLQIEDTARALAAVNQALNPRKGPLSIEGQGIAAGWVLYASLISPNVSSVTRLSLKDLSSDPAQGPFLLNIDRQMSRADALLLAASRVGRIDLVETAGNTGSWQAAADAAKKLNLGPIHVSVQK
jgi:hypothetical protein